MITGASVKKKEKASNAIPMCRPLLHSKPEWKSHASEGTSMLLEKNKLLTKKRVGQTLTELILLLFHANLEAKK